MRAMLGGAVVYQGSLYSIREINELKNECLLIKLNGEEIVPNVKLSEMTPEEDYDWEDDQWKSYDRTIIKIAKA